MEEKLVVDINIQSAYDEQYTERIKEWRELGGKYKAINIIEVCKGYKFHKVLECGAGEGSILMYLDNYQFCDELYAMEISDSGVFAINERNLKSVKGVLKFNGYEIPFSDEYFDLVILSHVLEHVEYPRLLLREIKRVSKYQVIEIPLDYSIGVDNQVDIFLAYGHINIFTPSLLRFLLKSEGFSIISDKLSVMEKEVIEFNRYKNIGRKKTLVSQIKLNIFLILSQMRRRFTRESKRDEFSYDAYTILCQHSGKGLQIF